MYNSNYIDNRPNVRINKNEVIPIDANIGLNPVMQPMKDLYDQNKVAILHGVGYPVPNRSHFRSMDIWHTAEPNKVGSKGWLGQAIKDLDPNGENVVTAVNFGRGLPRALVCKDIPVADPKSPDIIDYENLAEMTDGLSGADGASIANTAVSLVVHEHLDSAPDAKEITEKASNAKVTMKHFEEAVKKVREQKDLKIGEVLTQSYYR